MSDHALGVTARSSTPRLTPRGRGWCSPLADCSRCPNWGAEALGGLLEGLLARLRGEGGPQGERLSSILHKPLNTATAL
eukprot:186004-Pyramimonas_sp.AAC.1